MADNTKMHAVVRSAFAQIKKQHDN